MSQTASKQDAMPDTIGVTHNQRHDIQQRYQTRRSRSIALIERMLRSYLRPYLWLLGLSILANVIIAATTGALPWFIQQLMCFSTPKRNDAGRHPAWRYCHFSDYAVATYASNVIMNFVGQR